MWAKRKYTEIPPLNPTNLLQMDERKMVSELHGPDPEKHIYY